MKTIVILRFKDIFILFLFIHELPVVISSYFLKIAAIDFTVFLMFYYRFKLI
jgi:hypothetical protein